MQKTYIVEHLDPELGRWSALEYKTVARECNDAGAAFLLSSVPAELAVPQHVELTPGFRTEQRGVEELYAHCKDKVCLLDPAAAKELSPADGDEFNIFLFGGILGDDPPRDRTSELRKKGFQGRRLGPVQMTTDTAVRVTRLVTNDKGELDLPKLILLNAEKEAKVSLEDIQYVDYPELKFNEHESTEMPFRYVKSSDGSPIMPEGMLELIKKDSEKSLDDLI